jgi:hypothetical protein
MKTSWGLTFGVSRRGVGLVLLALVAFAPAAPAAVIVDNSANTFSGHTGASQGLVQDFTPTVTGNIGSVTLYLYSTAGGSMVVNLYSGTASSSSAGSFVATLGTISAGTGGAVQYTLNNLGSLNQKLTSGTVYGIEISGTTTIGWEYTSSSTTASGSNGSFTGKSWGNGGGVTWTQGAAYTGLAVSEVPEPINVALAVFGLMFVGGGIGRHYLARKSVSHVV